jgi:hypothetical protein
MSTKCTLAHSFKPDFHFYNECFDDENVYLEVGAQSITIPIEIWEVIRHYGAPRLDLADKTDRELLATVEGEVDARRKMYREASKERSLKRRKAKRAWANLFGCLTYGKASDRRPKQVGCGMAVHRKIRERQRAIRESIEKLKAEQHQGPYVIDLGAQKQD